LIEKGKKKEDELAEAKLNTGDKEVLDELENNLRKLESDIQDISRALESENDKRNKLESDKKNLARKLDDMKK